MTGTTSSHHQVDLPAVKLAFRRKYGLSLEDVVARDTVGDYNTVLSSVLATGDQSSEADGSGAGGPSWDIYRRSDWVPHW